MERKGKQMLMMSTCNTLKLRESAWDFSWVLSKVTVKTVLITSDLGHNSKYILYDSLQTHQYKQCITPLPITNGHDNHT